MLKLLINNKRKAVAEYLHNHRTVLWHDIKALADDQSEEPRKQLVKQGFTARAYHYVTTLAIDDPDDSLEHIKVLITNAAKERNFALTSVEPYDPYTEQTIFAQEEDETQQDASKTLAALDILCPGMREAIENVIEKRVKTELEKVTPREVKHTFVINDEPAGTIEGDTILDPQFEDICRVVQIGIPVYLFGPAGTGKSTIAEQVAKALGMQFYATNSVQEEFKLTGYTDALSNYIPSQFFEAFTAGGLFLIDELDASDPSILILINNALAAGYIEIQGKGRVMRHPDFRCIATGNTQGTGPDEMYCTRQRLDAATMNRFVFFEITHNPEIEKSIWENDQLLSFVRATRQAAEKCEIFDCLITYRDINNLRKLTEQGRMNMKKALRVVVTNKLSKDQRRRLASNLQSMPLNPWATTFQEIAAS